ncbi:MAG: DUF2721 domain-containing protein [Rhodospirillales bacterium]|nr:DUF2721 domain-containing protein [Rhodospirillales bacterium]
MNDLPNLLEQLVFISGIGLLLLSTANRYGHLEAHIKLLEPARDNAMRALLMRLLARGRLFRLALQCLYLSAALLSGGVLIGSLLSAFTAHAAAFVYALTAVSQIFVVVALIALVFETRGSIDILKWIVRPANGRCRTVRQKPIRKKTATRKTADNT